jgi:predicted metal-dependent hydrolase
MDSAADDSDDIVVRFSEGIKKFNEGEFFECHDILEDIWFEIRGSSRNFYQGLIHLAVGFYHITVRENPKGALSQLNKGIKKLNEYKPEYNGVELNHLLEKVTSSIKIIERSLIHSRKNFPANIIPKILFDAKKFNPDI